MKTKADKANEASQSRAVANWISKPRKASDTTFTFVDNRPEAIAQRKQLESAFGVPVQLQGKFATRVTPAQFKGGPDPQENRTGLPDNLKAGIETLSGVSMDNVNVHYNSSKPSQLQALAYTQGTDIHVGSGQERHLPHEAWHVVQQSQGRVKPTMKLKGTDINDNPGLEREADVMGAKALRTK